jgi:hypothetical protein
LIDASSFASRHNAFWAEHTPTFEHFVRRLNLEYCERWAAPLPKPDEQIRSAFVAELAFSYFCLRVLGVPESEIISPATSATKKRLLPLLDDPKALEGELSKVEQAQVFALANSLWSFFLPRKTDIITRPLFRGCGFVDTSEGDILDSTCLFEIKAVDRPFRSVDVRQLITYCALNHLSGQFELEDVGVFNPRMGIYFKFPIEEMSREVSGRSSQELFDSIVSALSSGDISR